jgi:hypothetical protein
MEEAAGKRIAVLRAFAQADRFSPALSDIIGMGMVKEKLNSHLRESLNLMGF